MDQNLPTPSDFIEKGEKRFSARFSLGYEDYLTFNRFLFQEAGLLDQSKKRLRLLGILALGAALIMTVAMLVLQLAEPVLIFCACALLLGGVLALCYYPLIFPRQMDRSVRSSYRESGYMNHEMFLEFYEDGVIDRSEEPPAAALWEDVHGFYETQQLFLFLMAYNQAVVVPKHALEDWEGFSKFAERKMQLSDFAKRKKPVS